MPKPQKHVFVCAQQRPPGHPRGIEDVLIWPFTVQTRNLMSIPKRLLQLQKGTPRRSAPLHMGRLLTVRQCGHLRRT